MLEIITLVSSLALFAGVAAPAPQATEPGAIKVEARGTIHTGVVAVGAETTGVELRTPDGTLELDLGGEKSLQKKADKLNGKTALVTGTLKVKQGVETGKRLILTVKTLEKTKDK